MKRMKKQLIKGMLLIAVVQLSFLSIGYSQVQGDHGQLLISTQERIYNDPDLLPGTLIGGTQEWKAEETAIIVCDMWDTHWCQGAAARVDELAGPMNEVLKVARGKGVFVVHAPSDIVDYYEGTLQRKLGGSHPDKEAEAIISSDKLPAETGVPWPMDQSDGGCDCKEKCTQGPPWPWTRQHDGIEIMEGDAISVSGVELAGLFREKGIKNVIMMGVHTNMCVVGRPFGLRNMHRLGMNTVLMRDMTDVMYNHEKHPMVSHFTGITLMCGYIESYICPTMLSTDFTGKAAFRFAADDRPLEDQ